MKKYLYLIMSLGMLLAGLCVCYAVPTQQMALHPKSAPALLPHPRPATPGENLMAYLTSKQTSQQKALAQEAVVKAQLIVVNYYQDRPNATERERSQFSALTEAMRQQGGYVEGGEHHSMSGPIAGFSIKLVFRRGQTALSAEQAPNEMCKPLQNGFRVKDLTLTLPPTQEVRRESFAKCQEVVKDFASRLAAMKMAIPALAGVDEKAIDLGEFTAAGEVHYPRFAFNWGNMPGLKSWGNSPGGTSTVDWGRIALSFGPIYMQMPQFGSTQPWYFKQDLQTHWVLQGSNDVTMRKIGDALREALQPLDKYEAELDGYPNYMLTFAPDPNFPGLDVNLAGLLPRKWLVFAVIDGRVPYGWQAQNEQTKGIEIQIIDPAHQPQRQERINGEYLALYVMPRQFTPAAGQVRKGTTPAKLLGISNKGYQIYVSNWTNNRSWPTWEQDIRTYFGITTAAKQE
jgi:hypothetical protein